MSDFTAWLAELRSALATVQPVDEEKDIAYGHQFTVRRGREKTLLSVYNGKKGRKLVWGGSGGSLQNDLRAAVCGGQAVDLAGGSAFSDSSWAGSDESGKGDFFGPLVVAAGGGDAAAAESLRAAGVIDCKQLSDKKVLELAMLIKDSVPASSVLELQPQAYNLRYRQLAAKQENLNQLLGYGHLAALTQVLTEQPGCAGALIDQFTQSTAVIDALQERFPAMRFRQQPGAESDIAVAAASVLARAAFLRSMEQLAALAGVAELPRGGGELATACAQSIADRLGKDALDQFVKCHFANYRRLA